MKQIVMVIEGHQWRQKLSLRENRLVCITCDQEVQVSDLKHGHVMPCHEAWSVKTGFPAVTQPPTGDA